MSFNTLPAELQGSILTWVPLTYLHKYYCRFKSIHKILTDERSDTNQASQELFDHIYDNPSDYLSTSSRNWSIPPREHINTVKHLIELFLSLFSSTCSIKGNECCSTRYSQRGKNYFERIGEEIAVDQKGFIIMSGYRKSHSNHNKTSIIIVLNKNLKEITSYNFSKTHLSELIFDRKKNNLYLETFNLIDEVWNSSITAIEWKDQLLTRKWECDISDLVKPEHSTPPYTTSHLITQSSQVFHVISGYLYKLSSDMHTMELVGDRKVGISRSHTIRSDGDLVFVSMFISRNIRYTPGIYSLNLKKKVAKPKIIFKTDDDKCSCLTIDAKERILFFTSYGHREASVTCIDPTGSSGDELAQIVWRYLFKYAIGGTVEWGDSPLACTPSGNIFLQTKEWFVSFNIHSEKSVDGSPIPEWKLRRTPHEKTTTPVFGPNGRIAFLARAEANPHIERLEGNLNVKLIIIDPNDKGFDPKNPKPIRSVFLETLKVTYFKGITPPIFDSEGRFHVRGSIVGIAPKHTWKKIEGIAPKHTWKRIVVGAGAALLVLMIVAIWRRRVARRRAALTLRP